MAVAVKTPNGKWLYSNKPRWVLMVTGLLDLSSRHNCKYACDKSSLLNYVPPDSDTNKSSALGKEYLLTRDDWLIVIL